jgi:hypothetical protein
MVETTDSEVNVAGLEVTMAYIEGHPDEHDQSVWARQRVNCATAMCFAGVWAALAGAEFVWPNGAQLTSYCRIGETVESISNYAERTLGLTSYDADVLFDETNTIGQLREMVDALKRGESIKRPRCDCGACED